MIHQDVLYFCIHPLLATWRLWLIAVYQTKYMTTWASLGEINFPLWKLRWQVFCPSFSKTISMSRKPEGYIRWCSVRLYPPQRWPNMGHTLSVVVGLFPREQGKLVQLCMMSPAVNHHVILELLLEATALFALMLLQRQLNRQKFPGTASRFVNCMKWNLKLFPHQDKIFLWLIYDVCLSRGCYKQAAGTGCHLRYVTT